MPYRQNARVAPGNYVDLDLAVMLSGPRARNIVADVRFDRDGGGFFVQAPLGAVVAKSQQSGPRADEDEADKTPIEWGTGRLRLDTKGEHPRGTFFVRTNRMTVARLEVFISQLYATPCAVFTWVRRPESEPRVYAGPQKLVKRSSDAKTELNWEGKPGEAFVVEERVDAKKPILHRVNAPRFVVPPRDGAPDLRRFLVRRVLKGGAFSLGTPIAVATTHAPARRFTVDFPRNWHRQASGLDLRLECKCNGSADLVFYAYGVYAPQGGVQRLGKGAEVFQRAEVLPSEGYEPVYGRIDDGDVHAVQLADGRVAKIRIEQLENHTLHAMRVHCAVLTHGGRSFLPRAQKVRFRPKGKDRLELRWSRVPGAVAYRVLELEGDQARTWKLEGKPGEEQICVVGPFIRNRTYDLALRAIDAHGEESDDQVIRAPLFDARHRYGRVALNANGTRCFDFDAGKLEKLGVADGRLHITGSAGGASYLKFTAMAGIASGKSTRFGDFSAIEGLRFGEVHEYDSRLKGTYVFFVRCKNGGIASVRIARASYPNVELEYVLRSGDSERKNEKK